MVRRITFFLDSLPVGGAERHAVHLAKQLNASGFEVSFLIYSGIRSASFDQADLPPRTQFLNRGSSNTDFEGWGLAGDAISEQGAELVVAVNQATLSIAVLGRMLGRHKAPIVCLFHSTKIATLHGRVRLPLFYTFLMMCEGMIFVSRNQRDYWRRLRIPARTSSVIVNGIHLDHYTEASPERREADRRRLGLGPEDFVIGISAQFRLEKNHEQLVEAAARLHAAGIKAKLVFVGEGVRRKPIEALVAERGLTDYALFAGEQKDVRPYLAAFDVGVICSQAIETMSLSAIECLATGTPMIMSDIGGASEFVDPGVNGDLFPAGDTDALTAALTRIADPAVRAPMRAAARRIAVERFAHERMVGEYIDYFEHFGVQDTARSEAA